MSLEGELQVALHLRAGRVAAVDITSTRPDVASRLLQGRRSAEVQAAVPLLFSVCAGSQATASRLACAAAAGVTPDAAALARARAALAEETVRETTWQVLLHQPRWLDEAPSPAATTAARAAQRWRWTGAATADRSCEPARTIAHAVFGCSAQDWLRLTTWPAVAAWAAAVAAPAARYLHGLAASAVDVAAGAHPSPAPPLLPTPTPGWLASVAAAAAAEPAYTRRPHWQGHPAETGALARLQGDPLLGSAALPAPSRALARHVARLRELALLLEGRLQPGVGALSLAPGSGVGWADNARGLLVHHVQLDGDRVRLYRIVAPTEWNFHPQGTLAAALVGAPAADTHAARQLAQRLINSLDPCVSCRVEVTHA
ncbi:MAG: nickel-dependent hydrogenase large subunit [Rubrivivax sp.]|nr:nickel-dependent hydrogenase large subunit [Rubrivivax sp.]